MILDDARWASPTERGHPDGDDAVYEDMLYTFVAWAVKMRYYNCSDPTQNGRAFYAMATSWTGPEAVPIGLTYVINSTFAYHGAGLDCKAGRQVSIYADCTHYASHNLWVRPEVQAFVAPSFEEDSYFMPKILFLEKPVLKLNGKHKNADGYCNPRAESYVYGFDIITTLMGGAKAKAGLGLAGGQLVLSDILHKKACSFDRFKEWPVDLADGTRIGNGIRIGTAYDAGISQRDQIEGEGLFMLNAPTCFRDGYDFATVNRAVWGFSAHTLMSTRALPRQVDTTWAQEHLEMGC